MKFSSKKELLQQHPLFSSLGWWQLRSVAKRARLKEIPKGQVIVRENTPAQAFYLVASGRCEGFTRMKSGQTRVFEHYLNGDSFGEMALLTKQPHWCSVRALNDSLLLTIGADDFDHLLRKKADLSRKLGERIARRIQELRSEKKQAKWSQIIAIGSTRERLGKTLFALNTAAALKRETGEPICVVDFSHHPRDEETPLGEGTEDPDQWWRRVSRAHPAGFHCVTTSLPSPEQSSLLGGLLGSLVTSFNYVFTVLPDGLENGVRKVYEQADTVYLLSDRSESTLYQTRLLLNQLREHSRTSPTEHRVLLTRLPRNEGSTGRGLEQTLGHPIDYRLPSLPEQSRRTMWEKPPHVFEHPDDPYSQGIRRIARHLGNVSVGLALGAGAARGLSHIGVLDVLDTNNVLVDVVAGSSIGALIAAAWAIGRPIDKMEEYAEVFEEWGGLMNWKDLTFPPTRAFFREKRIRKFLKRILGDATFSDTRMPLKITAVNLDEMEEEVITEGSLVDAVRASISIPMIFEPVCERNIRLVDGGVLSPLPIRALSASDVSRLIAVNTIPRIEMLQERERQKSRVLSDRGEGLWTRIKKFILPFGRGNIVDTLMRSIQAMQSQLVAIDAAEADVVIEPYVAASEWYDFQHYQKFIEEGRRTAKKHLEEIHEVTRSGRWKQDSSPIQA